MDWSAPYLIAAFSLLAVVEFTFIVMMAVTGRRHRVLLRRLPQSGPDVDADALTAEELGLLLGGDERLAQVALLRLYLERRVVLEYGALVLAKDPAGRREFAADNDRSTVRQAMLRKLRGGKRTPLTDVLYAGRRGGDTGTAQRRLAGMGLLDEAAARNVRLRDRAVGVYAGLVTFSLIAVAASLALAAPASDNSASGMRTALGPALGVCIGLFVVVMLLTGAASKLTGGRIRPSTPLSTAVLAQAKWQSPAPGASRDSLLRYVALHGLTTLPQWGRAAEYGELDAGMSEEMKLFCVFAEVFSAAVPFVGGDPGG
ncbi:MAG: TIGR04222 domain-containing membrane protein [Streptomycetales bacterium]